MATFVLVHGAWHGAWCWHKVVPELEKAGHAVVAGDLPGHGEDATPAREVSLPRYVDAVCRAVEALGEPVVLVGHSMGGLVISGVAERLPDRIERLVYLAAALPIDGEGFAHIPGASRIGAAVRPTEDGSALELLPHMVRDVFYQDCSDADVAFAIERVCPQPLAVRQDTLSLSQGRFGRVTREYVECLQDRAIEIDAQRRLHRRSPCRRVHTLDSSHSPFFSMPEQLTRVLVDDID